ncbi:MAG: inorganic phosphate transporter [Saprospiraceae bacterium]|nr:inorganic phosphate transporter [Saprospiraceae bacterium]
MFGIETNLDGIILGMFILCIFLVCFFEFVNGFHDTANAVATVIYTRTLKPIQAVIWSGFVNFLGVLASSALFGMAVATKISSILPLETVLNRNVHEAMAMVLAVLVGSILWNLGTWYFGIPCSSSHTMIGSLLGAGIAYAALPGNAGKVGVNWNEAIKIGNSLLISPLFGFSMAIILMFVFKRIIEDKYIFKEPEPDHKPPFYIRVILICTCTLVSFFHGSNDGQKGIGLMMIVLLAFLPTQFALSPNFNQNTLAQELRKVENTITLASSDNYELEAIMCNKATIVGNFALLLENLDRNNVKDVMKVRKQTGIIAKDLDILAKEPNVFTNKNDLALVKNTIKKLKGNTTFIPFWTILAISLSLGIGTMVGWKRIVVTIGEKIGKRHMTFAEGATAELVASSTIGLASGLGLPVSTTHVLSSGVAGAMVATKGIKNLQAGTVKNIVLAWVLTLPATILLSGALYILFRMFV